MGFKKAIQGISNLLSGNREGQNTQMSLEEVKASLNLLGENYMYWLREYQSAEIASHMQYRPEDGFAHPQDRMSIAQENMEQINASAINLARNIRGIESGTTWINEEGPQGLLPKQFNQEAVTRNKESSGGSKERQSFEGASQADLANFDHKGWW